jgi:hypothetical protein
MTMKHEIPLFDLFSGIGGFSYALHKACKTIGYCESSLKCQQILTSNMERKLIDSAPIHSDIVHLQKSQLAQQPVMITAGFPCQDISSANPYGDGLKGNRSKLVHHVFRLIDECNSTIKIVLLENVHNILHKPNALSRIESSLKKRGFIFAHIIVSCSELGAPMRRKRWFCLAIRGSKTKELLQHMCGKLACFDTFPWKETFKASKAVKKSTEQTSKWRCSMLGNAVVPACVVYAFQLLSSTLLPSICKQPEPNMLGKKWQIVITDGKTQKTIANWGTPSAQLCHWYPCHIPWTRCSKLLSKQVFMELGTIKKHGLDAQKTHEVNPCFVEWLMGYPRNYTLVKKT